MAKRKSIKKDWPSLEIAVKASQYRGYLLLEFLKRFYDRRSVIERYDTGEMTLHVHGLIGDRWYCETFYRRVRRNSCRKVGGGDNQVVMLVGIGQGSENRSPTTTLKRLQSLDRCLVPWGKEREPGLPAPPPYASMTLGGEEGLPRIWVIFDRELSSLLSLSAVQVNKLVHEIVESRSQVIDQLSNENGDLLRKSLASYFESSGNSARDFYAPFECGINFSPQPRKMFFCPSYSRERIIKRWLTVIGRRHEPRFGALAER